MMARAVSGARPATARDARRREPKHDFRDSLALSDGFRMARAAAVAARASAHAGLQGQLLHLEVRALLPDRGRFRRRIFQGLLLHVSTPAAHDSRAMPRSALRARHGPKRDDRSAGLRGAPAGSRIPWRAVPAGTVPVLSVVHHRTGSRACSARRPSSGVAKNERSADIGPRGRVRRRGGDRRDQKNPSTVGMLTDSPPPGTGSAVSVVARTSGFPEPANR